MNAFTYGLLTKKHQKNNFDCGVPELNTDLHRYPSVPAALLGRLAVDKQHTGIGLGGSLLVDAILNASHSTTGTWAIHVDAKDQQARDFYLKYGFISFIHKIDSLYLPLTSTLLRDLGSFSII